MRRDQHAKERVLQQGDCVYVKNFASGSKWLPGVIHRQSGPVSFVVDLLDGRQVRRHQDHVRVRTDAEEKGSQSVSHKDGGSSSMDCVAPVCIDGLLRPPDGLSEQTASPAPAAAPIPPSAAQSVTQSVDSPVAPRRSERQHKPPERLNC